MSAEGVNKFAYGAKVFVDCARSEACTKRGLSLRFGSCQETARTIEEVLRAKPDTYAALKIRRTPEGMFEVNFGGENLPGNPLSDPRKKGSVSVERQCYDSIKRYYDAKTIS